MYQAFSKFNDRIYAVVRVLMMVLLGIMSLMVFTSVFFRFAKISLPWVEEFSIYCFSWLTYFGAAVVLRNDGHLRVTALIGALKSEKVKLALSLISQIIVFVFICIIAFYSADMVLIFYQNGATSINVPAVKMAYVFFQIPLNYVIYALFTAEKIWGAFVKKGVN